MVVRILIRWLITAIAVAAAVLILNWLQGLFGTTLVTMTGQNAVIAIAVLSAVLGLLNAILRPILTFLSCGCIVATLGLFIFVINAFVLWFSGVVAGWFSTGFSFTFWGAFWGAIIISVVSFFLNVFIPDDDESQSSSITTS